MLLDPEPDDIVQVRPLDDGTYEVLVRHADGSESLVMTRELCVGKWTVSEAVRGEH